MTRSTAAAIIGGLVGVTIHLVTGYKMGDWRFWALLGCAMSMQLIQLFPGEKK